MVIIHNSELLSETNDTTGTSGLQLLSKSLEELIARLVGGGWSSTDLSSENFRGEFFVIKGATSVFVIELVKIFQILIRINKI